jgi:integrase
MARRPKPPEKPPRRRRGSGSIVTLKSGVVRARLPADVDPRRPSREFPPGHIAEAEAWLAAQLAPQPAETPTVPLSLGDWAGAWWETYVEPVRAPNTARWYLFALQRLAPFYDTALTDIRASALQAVIAKLAPRYDGATLQAIVGVWRRCLDGAVEDELLTRNPARRLVVPRTAPREAKRHVTRQEIAELWPAIRDHRFEAAYALLLGCGLRIGEVLGLHWEHVDLAARRAWIGPQWTNSHWRDRPKNHRPRWVTLPEPVVAALIRHHNGQPEGAVLVMQSPFTRNFGPNKRGRRLPEVRPWSAQVVGKDLATLCVSIGLQEMTAHAARRGLSTALLDGGASPASVAERLGHASPATTLRHYSQISTEAKAHADDLIAEYLGQRPEGDSGGESKRSG